ncbi:MAG: hypothetical protein HOD92_03910 [Deltaproteobacteria bacterium]|nr:hypothetical protein [Deltaproteobacteria bacterium]
MYEIEFHTTEYNFEHLCQPLKFPEGKSELREVYKDMRLFWSDGDVKSSEEYLRNYLGLAFGLSRGMVDKYLLDIECFDDEDNGK